MEKVKTIKYDDSILVEALKSYKDEHIEAFVNSFLQTIKEKRSEQERINKKYQAPFCCGHRMTLLTNGYFCSKCNNIK